MVSLLILQWHASPILTANSTTRLFNRGKVPGCANEITSTFVFGALPKTDESALKILVFVRSCA
jgi:hypothetical protein